MIEIQGGIKMKISKLGSALAFCLALSAGQAHAEPWQVTAENRSLEDITSVEFAQGAFTGTKQNSGIIYSGKTGVVKFDKPSGACKFDIKVYYNFSYSLIFPSVDVCGKSVNLNTVKTTAGVIIESVLVERTNNTFTIHFYSN